MSTLHKSLVLVVDDQHQNLQLAASVLSPLYNVVLTDNGEKALPYALKKKPDLILLDVMMPEISGFEVCRQLKEHPDTQDIPVIFLTAKTEEDDIVNAYEAGGVDYVGKPFRTRELLARIAAHITLKEQHEAIVRINSDLEEMNKQKDRLLSVVAHDMRNTIGSISNLMEVLIPDIDMLSSESLLEYLHLVKDSSERMYALFDELLLWAKNQFQNIACEQMNLNVKMMIEGVVSDLDIQTRNKNIQIRAEVDESIEVYADINMFNTILRNLLSNAIKFSNPNSEIRLQNVLNGTMVELAVVDQGIGIKPEDLDKIFDMSLGFTTPGTKGEKGTGLGLDLCNDFVKRHSGVLWVESEYGKGSTFKFTLPLSQRFLARQQETGVPV